jgi:hypothetical protein
VSVPARAEILELITEMAARLGRAPGRKLFADETGITEAMWVTYWPRWSDALVDAGLAPNELQVAIPDDELLEHLARLVRHLGKWPTFNEMRTVVRSDNSYPSFNTLTRLGTKSEMLHRLHGFAKARPEWHDVQALLPEETPTAESCSDGAFDRAFSVPGTADTSRTERTTRDSLNGDTSDIPPAQSTYRQVTAPPAESARGHFQADDAGSIPVVQHSHAAQRPPSSALLAPRRQIPDDTTFANKTDTRRWLATVEADIVRSHWIDPDAGKIPFGE